MEFGLVIAIWFFLIFMRSQYARYLARKNAKDELSVVYLSKHHVIATDIKRAFESCFFGSNDVISANNTSKNAMTNQKRDELEGKRTYLLKQWDLLEEKITKGLKQDMSHLIALRQRDRGIVQKNNDQWRIYANNLKTMRTTLQSLRL
ncbi:MAG: hypothetical protein JWM07_856 [Candidatus Saccharibacteria bacterium]|nr:hypothetical protein [Candidatus Saccharibacteria bacterium]